MGLLSTILFHGFALSMKRNEYLEAFLRYGRTWMVMEWNGHEVGHSILNEYVSKCSVL